MFKVQIYAVYQISLKILSWWAKRLYDTILFRLFRIHFNLAMIAVLVLVSPPTASSYLWFFFAMPLLATLGYFGTFPLLSITYLEVCASILVVTLAQGWPTSLGLATMVAKDAILGLLMAVLYFFVRLSPRAREESTLLSVATTLINVLDQRELCQLLADAAKAGISTADAAVVHLLGGEDNRTLIPLGSSHLDLTALGQSLMRIGVGIAGQAIQNRGTINIPDVNEDDRYHPLPPSFTPLKSLLVAPMYVSDKNVGAISVNSAKRGAFGRRDERFLTMLAAQGAMAIANAELYDTRARRRQQVSDILQASGTFSLSQSLDDLLETVAAEVRRCSGYRMVVVNLLDEAKSEIMVKTMAGVPPEGRRKLEGMHIPLETVNSLLREEFRISQSFFIRHDRCPETTDFSQYAFTPSLSERKPGEWHQEDMLIVPIQTQEEKLVGYISVDDPIDRQLPSRDTVQALEILASVAATAIENARLYEEQQRRAAQLALLSDIGGKIAAVLDLDSVMDRAVCLVQEGFGYHHVALFTMDRERGELEMRTRAGDFAHLYPPDHRLKLGQGMVGWVGVHGKKALANDVDAEPRYVNLYPGLIPTRSELSVPVQVGGEIVGVLDVQSPQPNAFDDNDVLVMEILADQVAVALENARLYREADRRETRLKDYLSTATSSLAHHTSLEGLYDFIVETGARFLSARDCSLFLVSNGDRNAPELVAVASSSLQPDEPIDTSTDPASGLVSHVIEQCQPVRLLGKEMLQHQLWNDELWKRLGWYFDPESDHSLLAMPMCMPEGCIFGVLVARGAESENGFSEFDEALLKALATNAAADFERVKDLEKVRKEAVDAARARLATDLHDAMNVLATGVRWEADMLSDALEVGEPDAAHTALTRLKAALDRGYTELRYLLEDLHDPTLQQEGLIAALKKRVELVGGGRIRVHGDLWGRLPPKVEGALYRVGQEAMDNAVRHSGVFQGSDVKIDIWLERSDKRVKLYVKDDGVGFDVDTILALPHKWGLRRLHGTLLEVGGNLEIISAPGKGTTVCATVSLPEGGNYGQ